MRACSSLAVSLCPDRLVPQLWSGFSRRLGSPEGRNPTWRYICLITPLTRLTPMALTCALILVNSHGITRKISRLLMNIPCFSVCFRGELEVKGGDITQVSAIPPDPTCRLPH